MLIFCCSKALVNTVENKDTAPSVDNSVPSLALELDFRCAVSVTISWSDPDSDTLHWKKSTLQRKTYNFWIVVTLSTFDNEIIQKPLYISIKILHPNYCQNFSRANDTCCYVYLKPGICILSKQVTQYYLYLTYIVKAKNPLSNEKKYIYTRMITIQIVYCVYISISEHVLGWFSPVLFIATHGEKIYTIDHNASQAHVLFCDFFKQSIWK